jgi:hypothetical protein
MDNIFKSKKPFLVDYLLNGKGFGVVVMAHSDADARRRFDKKMLEKIDGLYPYPRYEVTGTRRVYNKIQI